MQNDSISVNGVKFILKKKSLLQVKKGIETGYHYQPNHYLTIYKTKNQRSFPVTESVFPKLISLPLHPDLSKNDVHYVAESIKTIVNKKAG